MRKRPETLTYLAFLLTAASLSFLKAGSASAPWLILKALIVLSAALCAYLIWTASRWVLVGFPLLGLLCGAAGYQQFLKTAAYPTDLIALAALGACYLSLRLLFSHDSWAVIRNPELRWWLTPPRLALRMPASFRIDEKEIEQSLETVDLSWKGAFLKMNPEGLECGARCWIRLEEPKTGLGFQCRARIARIVPATDATDRYPAGVGVEFDELPRTVRRTLGKLLKAPPQVAPSSA